MSLTKKMFRIDLSFSFSLIHRMIVREPEKRATLDDVMNDIWYKHNGDDDDEINSPTVLSYRTISIDDHQTILRQMIEGNVASNDVIVK